jgi:chromosome partitioning protein
VKVVSITNQKGGVGKTTLAFHLANMLEETGYKVLLIDIDPQGNLTHTVLHQNKLPIESHIMNLFEEKPLNPMHVKDGLLIIGSDIRLSRFEADTKYDNFFRVRSLMSELDATNIDYVVIDTPPNLGLFTMNAILASDKLVVPVDLSDYSLIGVDDLINTVNKVNRTNSKKVEISALVLMGYIKRARVGKRSQELIDGDFKNIFVGAIPHSVKVKEAMNEGIPVWDISKKVGEKFKEILEKIIRRIEA